MNISASTVSGISSDADALHLPVDHTQRLGGRYALLRVIASGGMAVVWEATDEVLGRTVAVKVLHRHLTEDPAFVQRFRAEARAAARLSQASIVSIYDTVSEPGSEAIVMEYVEGMTLRTFLDGRGQLPIGDAADVLVQVANALEAADDANIVHRDIKPANILMCNDRRVKVTDFGIAKALEDEHHTTQGTLLGTAKYLAPEQAAGEPVDRRADIYSLGVVAYEALVGVVPFSESTSAATALARLHQVPPPPRSRRPDLPVAVERVVLTALARRPQDRFATAAQFRDALIAAIEPSPTGPDPTLAMRGDELRGVTAPSSGAVATANAVPASAVSTESTSNTRRRSDVVRALVVTAVIVGSFALGVGLILATSAGRDLFERVRDTLTDNSSGEPGSRSSGGTALGDGERPDATANSTTAQAAAGLAIARIIDYDPGGDSSEHGDLTFQVVDGDSATSWSSERYDNRSFGNLKSGVGLILELDRKRPLWELRIESPTIGWSAEAFVADGAPATRAGWGELIDARVDIPGTVILDLRGAVGSHVLIWVTDLGDEVPEPRIEISEVTLS